MRWLIPVLMVVPLAAVAQNPDAAHLSPDVQTLYAHGAGDAPDGWMNSDPADSSDDALPAGQMTDSSFTWTFTLDPPITRAVSLGDGDIEVTAYLGASQGVGQVEASTRIEYAGQVLATGEAQTHVVAPATASSDGLYGAVAWSLTPVFTALPPGEALVWIVTVEGTASSLFISVGEGRGRSNIVLPVASVEAAAPPPPEVTTIHENLTGDSVGLVLEEDNTTARWVYNWTTDLAAVDVRIAGVPTVGRASVRVLDGAGAEVANASFVRNATGMAVTNGTDNATGNVTLSSQPVAPGNWTIAIEMAGYAGTVEVQIGAPGEVGGEGGEGTETGGTEGGDKESDGDKGSPGFSILLALVALLLVRRRA